MLDTAVHRASGLSFQLPGEPLHLCRCVGLCILCLPSVASLWSPVFISNSFVSVLVSVFICVVRWSVCCQSVVTCVYNCYVSWLVRRPVQRADLCTTSLLSPVFLTAVLVCWLVCWSVQCAGLGDASPLLPVFGSKRCVSVVVSVLISAVVTFVNDSCVSVPVNVFVEQCVFQSSPTTFLLPACCHLCLSATGVSGYCFDPYNYHLCLSMMLMSGACECVCWTVCFVHAAPTCLLLTFCCHLYCYA